MASNLCVWFCGAALAVLIALTSAEIPCLTCYEIPTQQPRCDAPLTRTTFRDLLMGQNVRRCGYNDRCGIDVCSRYECLTHCYNQVVTSSRCGCSANQRCVRVGQVKELDTPQRKDVNGASIMASYISIRKCRPISGQSWQP